MTLPNRSRPAGPADILKVVESVVKADSNGQLRLDGGWVDTLGGINDPARDKRNFGQITTQAILGFGDLQDLYRVNDMAAAIVDRPSTEMVREGWNMSVPDDPSLADDIEAAWDALDLKRKVEDALRYARALGGAGIIIGANDGMDPKEPLDPTRMRATDDAPYGILYLTVLNRWELAPLSFYGNPLAPKFGETEYYLVSAATGLDSATMAQLVGAATQLKKTAAQQQAQARLLNDPATFIIHESRILKFDGVKVTRYIDRQNNGWGDSVLQRCHEVVRDFDLSWGAASVLIRDFAQSVYGIKGLAEIIMGGNTEAIQGRIQVMDMARSVLRSVVIDTDETFERKQTPVSGLPELLDRMANRLAAAAQMPVTLMMGQAPAGLNATGESDIRSWYDTIAAKQIRDLLPPLKRFTKVMLQSTGGEPDDWRITFNPLYQLTDKERAEVHFTQAQADNLYIGNGTLTPDEVAEARFGGAEYSMETHVDMDERQTFEERNAAAVQQQQELMASDPNNPKNDPNAPSPQDGGGGPPDAGSTTPKEPKDG